MLLCLQLYAKRYASAVTRYVERRATLICAITLLLADVITPPRRCYFTFILLPPRYVDVAAADFRR